MKIIKLSDRKFANIAVLIKRGKIIVFPTDTVYGLLADATNKKTVGRIFKIKKRSKLKPFPIFVKDISVAKDFVQIDENQEEFLKKAWPGKITAVLKRKKIKKKLYGVDKQTIGLRIPDYNPVRVLLKKVDRPLIGTSANLSGLPASTKIKEIIKQFQNQKFQPDLIIDAGNLPKSKPSKIIDLTGKKPIILRR